MNVQNFNTYVPLENGLAVGTASVPALGTVCPKGLPTGPVAVYKIKPQAVVLSAILPSVASYPSGTLPIAPGGGGVTRVTDPNSPYNNCLELDVPRGLDITCTSGNSGGAATITVNGFDYLGNKITKAVTITALVAGADVFIPVAFKYIQSITTSATLTNVQIGTADIFGLPYALFNMQDVYVNWGGTANLNFLNTLAGTTTTITNNNVGPNSIVTYKVIQAVNSGTYTLTVTAGTISIASTSNTDASVLLITINNPTPFITTASTTVPQTANVIGGGATLDTRGTVSLVDYNYSNNNQAYTGAISLAAQPANGSRALTVMQYLPQVLYNGVNNTGQKVTEYVGVTPYSNF